MSLVKYRISFSGLSSDEKELLSQRIDAMSWNGLFWHSDFQSAYFYVDDCADLSSFNIPDSCHLTRSY